jgi:cell division protein FtsI/penicillin-binding protein 2
MRGRSGTAVVIDVSSGRILAEYHPEVAARRLAGPGSASKLFTLLALLQSGKLNSTDSLVCRRNLHVGQQDLSCSHPQTGPLQAVSALAYSCNDFFATFGLRLTAEDRRAAFTQAGLASPSGFVTTVGPVGFEPTERCSTPPVATKQSTGAICDARKANALTTVLPDDRCGSFITHSLGSYAGIQNFLDIV